jgi:hypothetical protein
MTDWREELIEKMALQIGKAQFGDWVINPTEKMREQARAALAVAEPVIREQCVKMADAIAKDYRVYRDHFPHAEGAEQVAAAIREGGENA